LDISTTETPTEVPAPIAKGQRSDARRNRARIVAAARAAFAEQGPDASLEGIARSACVGISTLYRHFPNRQALVEAVFQDSMEQRCAEARGLLTARSPCRAFETWLAGELEHAATYGALAAWLMLAQLDDPCEGPSSCERLRAGA
jgi:AcrR family transcriptional regulator